MSDLYAVDLSLDLQGSVPIAVLADLRWHLGIKAAGEEAKDLTGDMGGAPPLLAVRGPATRIGGVLMGELCQTAAGWSLTARQEMHAELLPELDSLVERLAWNASTEGVIGYVRFYEEDVPDLLVNRSGSLVKISVAPTGTVSVFSSGS